MIARSILLTLFVLKLTVSLFAQTTSYNLLFEAASVNGSQFCVDVLIGFDQTNRIGSSEIYISYSPGLSNPSYQFDGLFDPPIYTTPVVATETEGIASIKFDLLEEGAGTGITQMPGRSFLLNICFDVVDEEIPIELEYIGTGQYATIIRQDGNPNILSPNQLDSLSLACAFVFLSCDDGDPYTIFDEIQDDCSCAGEPIAVLQLSVFLEGAYDQAGLMQDQLRQNGLLTTVDPYGYGIVTSEEMLWDLGTNSVVDWVIIELRDPNYPTKVLGETVALLRRNGQVSTADDSTNIIFPNIEAGPYYVVIDHYNHLPIMTKDPVDLSQSPSLNLTLDYAMVSGFEQGSMMLQEGFGLMWSGDANGDGTINAVDKNAYWLAENGQPYVYGSTKADFTMDGAVNAVDKNAIWIKNNSKRTFVPERDSLSGKTTYVPSKSLKSEADFPVGTAVKYSFLTDQAWKIFAETEFDRLTPEFEVQMDFVHPEEHVYYWEIADSIVNYAEQNGLDVHWHSLVYHRNIPDWMVQLGGDSTALEEALKSHIQTIVGRYKGRIKSYDLVNEGLNDNYHGPPTTFFAEALGPGYIARCFEYAHEEDPDALLFLNDYGTTWEDYKRQNLIDLLDDFMANNIPIHGVGFQMHGSHNWPFFPEIELAVDAVIAHGLLVHFAELDIMASNDGEFGEFTPILAERQRQRMKELVQYYKTIPTENQFGITIWGYKDTDSWYTQFVPFPEWPLLLNENGEYKLMHVGFLEGCID